MKNILIRLNDLLSEGESPVLATIVRKDGSAPRTAGARMIVSADGSIYDTIGGGRLEANVIEDALAVSVSGQSMVAHYRLSGDDADSMEMICGGSVSVLIERIEPSNGTKALFQKAEDLVQKKKRFLFAAGYSAENGKQAVDVKRGILATDGTTAGDLVFPENSWTGPDGCFPVSASCIEETHMRYFVEPVGSDETVYIFGGGHIARQIEMLTDMIGMKTVVLDDRKAFAESSRFRSADVVVPMDYKRAFDGLEVTGGSYIVIVTRGHIYDRDILRQALKTDAGYIGMIGSLRKRDTLYRSLELTGVSREALDRVRCPIGLAIGSETPQEIAVSIVAELISVRRGQGGR
jgi:xanthine dehydrogenase accessory factor